MTATLRCVKLEVAAIVGLVFGKARPFQLDATISSLKHQCVDFGAMDLHLLNTTSISFFAGPARSVGRLRLLS